MAVCPTAHLQYHYYRSRRQPRHQKRRYKAEEVRGVSEISPDSEIDESALTMLYPVALLLALLLAAHGLRKGSLSQDGAITAFLAGYAHLANPIKLFGVLLIGFYLIGSRATKVSL